MLPKTQEYLEAAQEDVNEQRKKFVETLDPEIQKQFSAVEAVVKTLVDNGVYFYLFPLLPKQMSGQKGNKQTVWQWNSLVALGEYDENGKISDSSKDILKKLNNGMLYNMFCLMATQIDPKLSIEEKLEKAKTWFGWSVIEFSQYLHNENPEN